MTLFMLPPLMLPLPMCRLGFCDVGDAMLVMLLPDDILSVLPLCGISLTVSRRKLDFRPAASLTNTGDLVITGCSICTNESNIWLHVVHKYYSWYIIPSSVSQQTCWCFSRRISRSRSQSSRSCCLSRSISYSQPSSSSSFLCRCFSLSFCGEIGTDFEWFGDASSSLLLLSRFSIDIVCGTVLDVVVVVVVVTAADVVEGLDCNM